MSRGLDKIQSLTDKKATPYSVLKTRGLAFKT